MTDYFENFFKRNNWFEVSAFYLFIDISCLKKYYLSKWVEGKIFFMVSKFH